MSDRGRVAEQLAHARALAAKGEDDAAKEIYVAILRRDPTHFAALNELGTLAYASGHRAAALTAYEQAVRCHPDEPMGRVNLGNLLAEDGALEAARGQYAAALAADPDLAEAHQGLARVLSELGEAEAAAPHWQKGFIGHALVQRRYRGPGTGVAVLLLVAAKGGNIPTQNFLDDRIFAVTALYPEFADPMMPLPPHAVVLNAIGDADLCAEALERAAAIAARTRAPVVNRPALVQKTGRAINAQRLAGLRDVVVPRIATISRANPPPPAALRFPLLLRAPGFHTGRHFERVDHAEDFAAAAASLPDDAVLLIDYLDARGADGLARKYRVMCIDGALYPLHLAISPDWKVHYFTADMAKNAAHRAEEERFLEDMPGVLGAKAVTALGAIASTLALDYAGIDFGLTQDGAVLFFEANATMVINPPDADPIWDYRRHPIGRALDAARQMLLARALR